MKRLFGGFVRWMTAVRLIDREQHQDRTHLRSFCPSCRHVSSSCVCEDDLCHSNGVIKLDQGVYLAALLCFALPCNGIGMILAGIG